MPSSRIPSTSHLGWSCFSFSVVESIDEQACAFQMDHFNHACNNEGVAKGLIAYGSSKVSLLAIS